jgi:hypothetical protein
MADISFEQRDASDPSNGGWMDFAEDGGTRTSFWTAPAAPGWMIEFAITGLSSGGPSFEVIGLSSSGAVIAFEQLGAGGQFAWMDAHDGEGGVFSIWTAPAAPGGVLEVTVVAVPGAARRVAVAWLDTRPVAKPAQVAKPVAKPAQVVKPVRVAKPASVARPALLVKPAGASRANVIDLTSWRQRGRPN